MTYFNKNTYQNVTPYNCSVCGKLEEAKYHENKRMVDKQFCFNCNFWDEKTEPEILNRSVRIDGQHYMVGEENQPHSYARGFGGRQWTIKMNDGRVIETTNLWFQGVIPDEFKSKLPNNAEFVEIPKPIGHGQGFLG